MQEGSSDSFDILPNSATTDRRRLVRRSLGEGGRLGEGESLAESWYLFSASC